MFNKEMRIFSKIFFTLIFILFLIILSENMTMSLPAEFEVKYQWIAASMPPPGHYEYTILIKIGGKGKITYTPNYSNFNPPIWIEEFTVSKENLEKLWNIIEKNKILTTKWAQLNDKKVGGSRRYLDISIDKLSISIPVKIKNPEKVSEIYDLIKELVPEEIWTKLNKQREEYSEKYDKKNN